MGEAKRRGTREQRVALATEAKLAAAEAKRAADFEAAKARRRAEREAQEQRVDLGDGRAVVVSGGRSRRANQLVVLAALAAALAPTK